MFLTTVIAVFSTVILVGVIRPGSVHASSYHKVCTDHVRIDFESTADGASLQKGDVIDASVHLPAGLKVEARRSQRRRNGPFIDGMIFDTRHVTGRDFDLATDPTQRNILIVSADNDSKDPDDAGRGGLVRFFFDLPVELKSMKLIDVEDGAQISITTSNGSPNEVITIPEGGDDGNIMTVDIGVTDVTSFTVKLHSSGGIDDVLVRAVVDCDPEISVHSTILPGEVSSDYCPGALQAISGVIWTSVTFCIAVKNIGNAPLSYVTVEDEKLALYETIPLLEVGEEVIFVVVQELTVDMENDVTATGFCDGDRVVDTDTSSVTVLSPKIRVENTVVEGLYSTYCPGVDVFGGLKHTEVTFCLSVMNMGHTALKNVDVNNPVLEFYDVIPLLLPGESVLYNVDGVLKMKEVNNLTATGMAAFLNGSMIPNSMKTVSDWDVSEVIMLTSPPSNVPTETPTNKPTISPTESPTNYPTRQPTSSPTISPTHAPQTQSPTESPSDTPTNSPTNVPTESLEDCYSYAGIKMAHHMETLTNCGGRSCYCFDGTLTCEAKCKVRPAYHTTTNTTKQDFLNALNWVNSQGNAALGNHLETSNPRSYNSVIQDHIDHGSDAHWNSKFLPWHRCYLCEFEQLLQLYDVCVTIPYWYHPVDSGPGLVNYHVLDNTYLGDEFSPFGQLNSPWNVPPGSNPFSRGLNNDNSPLPDACSVALLLSEPTFASYRSEAEGVEHHYIPHIEVGGNMGNFEAPADPLFWLHHGMVDRNWAIWQVANGGDYDGDKSAVVSAQWGVVVGDVTDGNGLWTPSVTTYKNYELPTGDHCAVCHLQPFTTFITDLDVLPLPFFLPQEESFDETLAGQFDPEELRVRFPDDPLVASVLEASPDLSDEELVDLVKDDCDQLQLPEKILDFVENFNAPLELVRRNLCDIILRPVASDFTTIRVAASFEEPEEEMLPCANAIDMQQQALLSDETDGELGSDLRIIVIPVSAEELVERIGAVPCPQFDK